MTLARILLPLIVATAALATARPTQDSTGQEVTDSAALEAELERFVERYLAAFAEADPEGIRAVCSTSPSFAWYENGKLRYPSVDRILEVISSMPADMTLVTLLSDRRLRVVTPDVATLAANFVTTGSRGGQSFETEGVVTLFVEREAGAWRIVLGHTSARFNDR